MDNLHLFADTIQNPKMNSLLHQFLRAVALVLIAAPNMQAQTLTTIHAFTGGDDGSGPGALLQGGDGNLYGTTSQGGASGHGTVYRLTLGGTLTTLYSFSGGNDGDQPLSLLIGKDGNFYGSTIRGGDLGGGTIYRLTSGGTLTVLHSFDTTPNGLPAEPVLVLGNDGSIYVSTATDSGGNIAKLTTTGDIATIYTFTGADGGFISGFTQAKDGSLCGTTSWGGPDYAGMTSPGYGTVFRVMLSGTETTLYAFGDGSDGRAPHGLTQANDGTFYGVTTGSSWPGDIDTIFSLSSSGSFTTLHTFTGSDGGMPTALHISSDGNLYGTTAWGGDDYDGSNSSGEGTVYGMNPNGSLATLHSFSGPDGKWPGGFIFGRDGFLYGITAKGGPNDAGTVYRLSISHGGGAPQILVQPQSQTVQAGANVTFSVHASGTAPLTYQWRKNSAPLANNSHIVGVTTDSLTLHGVTAADAGAYSVVVGDSSGTTPSANAILTVLPVDLVKPTIAISRPSPSMQSTNAVTTIKGSAKDDVSVRTVYYQLNGGSWAAASGTTSWSASVTLVPGTNVFRACAVDSSGNWSVTNNLSLVSVLNAQLGVRIFGEGTVNPNYANQWLQIDKQYSMTVRPARGFSLENWSSNLSGLLTTGTTVRFAMCSNLVLTATLADVQRPVNIIKSPTVNQRVTGDSITVAGKASDNVGVTGVWYQMNSGQWLLGLTTDVWTNWTTVSLP